MAARLSRRQVLELGLKGIGVGIMTPAISGCALMSSLGLTERKRNVLFIAVDDLRPQLSCYGHQQTVSPSIERLAAGGILFERAYCQQAVCAPSRASLLTGLRPDSTGIYGLGTPVRQALPDVLTLPQHFKNHGYTTMSLGKIYHHHWRNDDAEGWSQKSWGPTGAWPGYATEEAKAIEKQGQEAAGDRARKVHGPPVEAGDLPDDAYADGRLTLKALEEMRRLKGRPFFLAVGYYKPHLALACPKRHWDLYRRDEIDLADNPFRPKGAPDIALHNWGELRAYAGMPTKGPVSDDQARELIHGYYACVSFIDAQIGRLLDELDRLRLRGNTVIVLWGDHGWNLGEHGLWCKHCNFETSVHSPLIVSVPGLSAAGQKSAALTEFVDIYPSLCELCELPVPDHLEGASFVPLLAEPDRPWKRAAFSQYPRGKTMGYTMKTDRYRYTEWRKPGEEPVAVELYDHRDDPQENVNVADLPQNKGLVLKLSEVLHAGWRAAAPR